jgi:hypothetical protein
MPMKENITSMIEISAWQLANILGQNNADLQIKFQGFHFQECLTNCDNQFNIHL